MVVFLKFRSPEKIREKGGLGVYGLTPNNFKISWQSSTKFD